MQDLQGLPLPAQETELRAFFFELAALARQSILPFFRQNLTIDNKDPQFFDPVTEADRAAEQALAAAISTRFPDHLIMGEEFGTLTNAKEGENFSWLIDPIDGTRAFVSGQLSWGSLVALRFAGRPVYGMLTQPFVGETFLGHAGAAWYREPGGQSLRPLRSRKGISLSEATLLTTSPFLFSESEREIYQEIEKRAQMVRYGTDCYGYAALALGCADCVLEAGLAPYDIAALIPLVQGAGGVITDWKGVPFPRGGQVLATASPALHQEILGQIQSVV